jgi:hypothetical protein
MKIVDIPISDDALLSTWHFCPPFFASRFMDAQR